MLKKRNMTVDEKHTAIKKIYRDMQEITKLASTSTQLLSIIQKNLIMPLWSMTPFALDELSSNYQVLLNALTNMKKTTTSDTNNIDEMIKHTTHALMIVSTCIEIYKTDKPDKWTPCND